MGARVGSGGGSRAPTGWRRATIRDVARRAGVSPSTVSRVLNGSSHPVSEQGRRRVLAAARRLAYIPNLLARSLHTHETAAIGVLIPDVSNPYYAAILRGVEDAIARTGRSVILCNTDRDSHKQHLYLRTLLERRVDGILVAGGAFGRAEAVLTAGRLPVVMIGRHPVRFPSVRVDNVAGAAVVTEYLLALGHRRIACLSGPRDSLTAADRVEGYRRALRAAGLSAAHQLVVEVGFAPAGLEWVVDRLFSGASAPTAVIAPNDQVAIGMIRALYERGLRVPDAVSVVGFDDTPLASYVIPSLTTMAVPMRDLGRVAVELLLALFDGASVESVVLPCTLHVRESTSVYRGRD